LPTLSAVGPFERGTDCGCRTVPGVVHGPQPDRRRSDARDQHVLGHPVRGTLTDDRVLRGSLDIVNFRARNNGELLAIGRLTGRILNADGDVLRRFSDVPVRLPLEIRQPALAPQ
jgi:hypothetical protein